MRFKVKDFYFKKAKKENYLARSVYKLEEIDQKYKLISSGDNVCDLGYFPGSWIQYSSKKVGPKGKVVGIDIAEENIKLQNLVNVKIYQKDIKTIVSLEDLEVDHSFDIVVSDMAPKTTGIKIVDQEGSFELFIISFQLLPSILKGNGHFVAKIFEGQSFQEFLPEIKKYFKQSWIFRPQSTRKCSKEIFFIGKNYIIKNNQEIK